MVPSSRWWVSFGLIEIRDHWEVFLRCIGLLLRDLRYDSFSVKNLLLTSSRSLSWLQALTFSASWNFAHLTTFAVVYPRKLLVPVGMLGRPGKSLKRWWVNKK